MLFRSQLINLGRDVALPVKSNSSQERSRHASAPNPSNAVKTSVSANNWKCPLCGGSHPDRKGKARKYLAACNAFNDQNIHQRWGTIRKLSYCQVCLTGNDHGKYGAKCTLQRIACKLCPDKPHHPLLCSKATANATTSTPNNSSAGDDPGKGPGGPKRRNNKSKKTEKGNSNSNIQSVTYSDGGNTRKRPNFSVFAERLVLLLQTLHSLSISPSSDASFKAKCRSHLEDDWFSKPLILQCCAQVKLKIQDNLKSVIGLSDNGSTLSFQIGRAHV